MSARRLNGFAELRTRPMNESEPRPVRRCTKCGAVLRRSNPSDLCAPCSGVRVQGLEPWITRQGQERMRMHVQVLRAGLNRQMDLDRKDFETARALNACIETAAKERPVAEPAHT